MSCLVLFVAKRNVKGGPLYAADLKPSARRIWIYNIFARSPSFFSSLIPATPLEEQDRFVSSIIKALEADEVLRLSTANSRAYVFRAELYCRAGRLGESIADAKCAVELLSTGTPSKSAPLLAKAYRSLADAYERQGNWKKAMEALQGVAAADPALRTKISKEMEQLKQRAESAS